MPWRSVRGAGWSERGAQWALRSQRCCKRCRDTLRAVTSGPDLALWNSTSRQSIMVRSFILTDSPTKTVYKGGDYSSAHSNCFVAIKIKCRNIPKLGSRRQHPLSIRTVSNKIITSVDCNKIAYLHFAWIIRKYKRQITLQRILKVMRLM